MVMSPGTRKEAYLSDDARPLVDVVPLACHVPAHDHVRLRVAEAVAGVGAEEDLAHVLALLCTASHAYFRCYAAGFLHGCQLVVSVLALVDFP